MSLTNTACRNAKPKPKAYKLADSGGLYLEVSPSGGKYWRLKYRFAGKEKRLALGVYPTVSLVQAREGRESAKKQLADFADPGHLKWERKRKAQLKAETTFELVAREWHALRKDAWSVAYTHEVLHRLQADVFPLIGKRPICDITPTQVLDCLRRIEDRGAAETARRAQNICKQIFRFAIITERAERNSAAELRGALRPMNRGHFAAIDADALPEFLSVLDRNEARLFVVTRYAIQLLLHTFVRTSELIGARWCEIDFERSEWHIPPERMKMRRPHVVPLSRQARAILQALHDITGRGELVFPSRVGVNKAMSNGTILVALRRMGYARRMTGHGFRALAMSTIKERLGYRHEVVDRQLAHAPANKVDAAYDRAAFLADRKRMMQEWADYLDKVGHNKRAYTGLGADMACLSLQFQKVNNAGPTGSVSQSWLRNT